MVVVEKLSKDPHFIPTKSTCKEIDIANIFMEEIFRLHGMPKEITSDIDTKFTSIFWRSLLLVLKLNCYLVQPITLKLRDRQKG
jgi:hypothetical protein